MKCVKFFLGLLLVISLKAVCITALNEIVGRVLIYQLSMDTRLPDISECNRSSPQTGVTQSLVLSV